MHELSPTVVLFAHFQSLCQTLQWLKHTRATSHEPRATLQWQKRRARVLLASQKARWELLQNNNAGFTVSESCTLGWLNVILRHLWPTLIEKEVAEATTKQIQVSAIDTADTTSATSKYD